MDGILVHRRVKDPILPAVCRRYPFTNLETMWSKVDNAESNLTSSHLALDLSPPTEGPIEMPKLLLLHHRISTARGGDGSRVPIKTKVTTPFLE